MSGFNLKSAKTFTMDMENGASVSYTQIDGDVYMNIVAGAKNPLDRSTNWNDVQRAVIQRCVTTWTNIFEELSDGTQAQLPCDDANKALLAAHPLLGNVIFDKILSGLPRDDESILKMGAELWGENMPPLVREIAAKTKKAITLATADPSLSDTSPQS